jgi:hypothetical protein
MGEIGYPFSPPLTCFGPSALVRLHSSVNRSHNKEHYLERRREATKVTKGTFLRPDFGGQLQIGGFYQTF